MKKLPSVRNDKVFQQVQETLSTKLGEATHREEPEVLVCDCLEYRLLAQVGHLGHAEARGHRAVGEHGVH